MRKLIAFVVMMTYMASAIGFSFSLHYCGGHYKYVCFTSDTEKGCCGKNEHKTNCCNDKVIKAKFKDNHNTSAKAMLSHGFCEYVAPAYIVLATRGTREEKFTHYIAKDLPPPLSSQVPLYLLNRAFRI